MSEATPDRAFSWPAIVLVLGLLTAAAAGWGLREVAAKESRLHFKVQADQLALLMAQRFHQPLYGLRGAAAFLVAAEAIDRGPAPSVARSLHTYVDQRDLQRDFPGVLGFGFVQRLARGDAAAFVMAQRSADRPDFELHELADHSHDDLYLETAIEPAGANAAAIGLDLGSEPRRRQALERAVETGEPTLTAALTLVQDAQHRPGFLLVLPIYRPGTDPTTPAQRRDALVGLLVAPLVADELLAGLADGQGDQLQFTLMDREPASSGAQRVFDSAQLAGSTAHEGSERVGRVVEAPGRRLHLQVRSSAAFDAVTQRWMPFAVFGFGALASVLLAALLRQQRRVVHQASTLARAMTRDLDRLALVARNTSDAVVITDLARRITWVNAAFETISGYSAAEALGRSPGELLQFGGTDPATVAHMRAALDAQQGIRCTVLNRSKAGREYWLALEIQVMREPDGTPTGFMAIESDITEQRLAEGALRASEAFLDKAGRIGGVGGWAYDLATQQVRWSDQICRMLEVEIGHQPTLAEFLALCAPQARARIQAVIEGRFEGETGWDFELPMSTARGRRVWARAVAEGEYTDGGMVRVVGALQDITARRAMQAEVERSALVLRGAIDAIDEAFVLYDPDDRLVLFNDKYRAVYAQSADVIQVGARFEDIIRAGAERGQYPAAVGRVEAWVTERMAAHRAGDSTVLQHLADGRVLRVVERRMSDGHLVGFRVDITDLVRATEAAEAASRAKSEFIATISHELRTPLQSVIGFSELGEQFAEDQPPFDQMFADIHAGGQRMLTLVNDLLDVSKFTGALGSLTLQPGDLAAVSAAVARELAALAAQRGVRLELPQPLPVLPAALDPFRMQQVLRNVLANAIRFAPPGSRVQLEMVDQGAAGVEVRVRDQGPGIPDRELDSIFEPFTQSTRTRDGSGGTGLGLAICRKIMAAHGGHIDAANASGGGALLRIALPPAPAAAANGATTSARTAPEFHALPAETTES